jgi:hypothetical protein
MVELRLGQTKIAIAGPSSNCRNRFLKAVANQLKPHAARGPFCVQAETPEKCSLLLAAMQLCDLERCRETHAEGRRILTGFPHHFSPWWRAYTLC